MTGPVRLRQPVERVSRVAPLGVRFRDTVTGADVAGLTVEAWPAGQRHRRISAVSTAAKVYGWVDLPGVRDRTFGAGDDAYWSSALPPLSYIVDVVDHAGRFLPFRFTARAPARGIWRWTCDGDTSPFDAQGAVPLYSAPSRVPPAATAVIRAELYDVDAERPAAWAVVAARSGRRVIGRGMTDSEGRLLLLAPYPEPVPPPLGVASGSPPGNTRVPLWLQVWPVQLDVSYGVRAGDMSNEPPDLCEALRQAPALAWDDDARRAVLGTLELRYGEELQVRSRGNPRGRLLVTRTDGGSPP